MPFDRLIRTMDPWSQRTGRADLFAQIGDGGYWPSYIQAVPFLTPQQFHDRMRSASAIVSHAGTGTIIAALQLGKPLLVLPRRAALQETRNDHQIPTAKHFAERGRIRAAYDEDELLREMETIESFRPAGLLGDLADTGLIARIRDFALGAS